MSAKSKPEMTVQEWVDASIAAERWCNQNCWMHSHDDRCRVLELLKNQPKPKTRK